MSVLLSAIVLAAVIVGHPSPAQAQAGWYLTPSFSLTEQFDDNVFVQPARERSDFISRFSPGLKAGFRSVPLTVEAGYTFDAETYANHPELSDPANRQRATVEFRHLPVPVLSLGLEASYVETQTPTDLNRETSIALARRRATQIEVAPSGTYRMTPTTSADVGYTFLQSDIAGGVTTTTQQGRLALTRRLTPVDSGTIGYGLSIFASEGAASVTSHAVTLGWNRRLAPGTVLDLRAGPRISDGTVSPEVSAGLEHRFKLARLFLGYSRSETAVVGQAGSVETERFLGSITLEPLALLELRVAPAIRRSSAETSGIPTTTVYETEGSISYRITRWMRARALYRFTLQEQGPVTLRHNVISVSLELSYPLRVSSAEGNSAEGSGPHAGPDRL